MCPSLVDEARSSVFYCIIFSCFEQDSVDVSIVGKRLAAVSRSD